MKTITFEGRQGKKTWPRKHYSLSSGGGGQQWQIPDCTRLPFSLLVRDLLGFWIARPWFRPLNGFAEKEKKNKKKKKKNETARRSESKTRLRDSWSWSELLHFPLLTVIFSETIHHPYWAVSNTSYRKINFEFNTNSSWSYRLTQRLAFVHITQATVSRKPGFSCLQIRRFDTFLTTLHSLITI